jgi:DNA-binding MarR family transcriptional regulator
MYQLIYRDYNKIRKLGSPTTKAKAIKVFKAYNYANNLIEAFRGWYEIHEDDEIVYTSKQNYLTTLESFVSLVIKNKVNPTVNELMEETYFCTATTVSNLKKLVAKGFLQIQSKSIRKYALTEQAIEILGLDSEEVKTIC